MKKKKLLAAGLAVTLFLCACTKDNPDSRGSIDDREEDPTPTVAAVVETPTPTEVPEAPPADPSLYEEMACWHFTFSSGVGGWATELDVNPDGSFYGEYYDYDMGVTGPGFPNGTKYECKFRGAFADYTETSPYIYKVNIGDIVYENTPGTEVTKDDTHYIYTEPYGIDGSPELTVYLPGASMEEIPKGYLSWVDSTNFAAKKNGIWDRDYSEDMPICGIYNEAYDTGFSSTNISGINRSYLINSEALPGLKNIRSDIKSDNTYYFEDMSDDGTIKITNICFRPDKDYLTLGNQENEAEFVELSLNHMFSSPEYGTLTVYGYDERNNTSTASTHVMVNGHNSVYATWCEGTNEDTRINLGVFTQAGMNWNADTQTSDPGYGYAYVISISPDYCLYDLDTLDKYLLSLTFSGLHDKLSSASNEDLYEAGFYSVKTGKNKGTIMLKELEMIYIYDTDKLKQYGLDPDPNNYGSDYAFGSLTDDFTEYDIADDCPIYFVYMENVFTQPLDIDEYATFSNSDPDGGIMKVYFNKKGEVIMIAEPAIY